MSARTTRLVVEREVREAARRKGIWALVALIFLGSSALMIIPELIPEGTDEIVVVGDDRFGVIDALEELPDRRVEVDAAANRDVAVAAVEAGDADLAVVLETPPIILVENEGSSLVTVVRETVANRVALVELGSRGVDPQSVGDAFTAATPVVEPIDVERSGREAAALALTALLYLLTVILTGQVANGVAIEKSNRVSEVLLAIVPPRSMLYGKVLGVGCIGLVTLLAGGLPVLARFVLGGDLPDGIGRTLLVSAAWFILGLALYLTIAGSLGALVSRQEEAGAVVGPLVTLLVAGYFVAVAAGDTALGAVLAYVPLISPMLEPYRIAVGAGSPIEYTLSLLILLASVVFAGRLGAVVFRRAIVRTGRKLSLREVLRSDAG